MWNSKNSISFSKVKPQPRFTITRASHLSIYPFLFKFYLFLTFSLLSQVFSYFQISNSIRFLTLFFFHSLRTSLEFSLDDITVGLTKILLVVRSCYGCPGVRGFAINRNRRRFSGVEVISGLNFTKKKMGSIWSKLRASTLIVVLKKRG